MLLMFHKQAPVVGNANLVVSVMKAHINRTTVMQATMLLLSGLTHERAITTNPNRKEAVKTVIGTLMVVELSKAGSPALPISTSNVVWVPTRSRAVSRQ